MGLSQPSFTVPVSIILHRLPPPSYLYGFWSSADMFLQVWPRILLMWEVCTPGLALQETTSKVSNNLTFGFEPFEPIYRTLCPHAYSRGTISNNFSLWFTGNNEFVICKEKNFWHKTERKWIVYDCFPLQVNLKILNEL